MRISLDRNDRAYWPHAYLCRATIDGAELDLAVTVDEERGYAIVYGKDTAGNFMQDAAGNPVMVKRRGVIKVQLPSWASLDSLPVGCRTP